MAAVLMFHYKMQMYSAGTTDHLQGQCHVDWDINNTVGASMGGRKTAAELLNSGMKLCGG